MHLSFEELYTAYLECRKHKRKTESAIKFETNLAENLTILLDELNNQTYKIGSSITFCVTRPKIREVFAADFRDRIVHHYIINKINKYFEDYFIEDTYNCRKRKGTLYGARRARMKLRTKSNGFLKKDTWILTCDIQGFFMSIDKDILYNKLENFLRKRIVDDIDWILWLVKTIVVHRPELLCKIKGNKMLWRKLPLNKSLFHSNGKGLAIGNLTSLIFANFYLSEFDHWITSFNIEYGRYVDDFYLIGEKKVLKGLLPKIRAKLKELGLTLHPKKINLLHFTKGFKFVGYFIKFNDILPGKRTIYNAKYATSKDIPVEKLCNKLNSYYGFLRHTKSRKIRELLWSLVKDKSKLVNTNMLKINVIKRYRSKELLKNQIIYDRANNEFRNA